jgi:hypothetical protein
VTATAVGGKNNCVNRSLGGTDNNQQKVAAAEEMAVAVCKGKGNVDQKWQQKWRQQQCRCHQWPIDDSNKDEVSGMCLTAKDCSMPWPSPSCHRRCCHCAEMLAAIVKRTTSIVVLARVVATKKMVSRALVQVVGLPCFFVRLADRDVQKMADSGKVGIAIKVFLIQTNLSLLIKAHL